MRGILTNTKPCTVTQFWEDFVNLVRGKPLVYSTLSNVTGTKLPSAAACADVGASTLVVKLDNGGFAGMGTGAAAGTTIYVGEITGLDQLTTSPAQFGLAYSDGLSTTGSSPTHAAAATSLVLKFAYTGKALALAYTCNGSRVASALWLTRPASTYKTSTFGKLQMFPGSISAPSQTAGLSGYVLDYGAGSSTWSYGTTPAFNVPQTKVWDGAAFSTRPSPLMTGWNGDIDDQGLTVMMSLNSAADGDVVIANGRTYKALGVSSNWGVYLEDV